MTVDDVPQSAQQQQQYLDFIEFCLAEYTDSYSTNEISQSSQQVGTVNDVNIRNKRKWSKNKIVDLDTLNRYQTRLKDNFELIQERLILFKIREVNHFTTYIPLDVLFQNTELSSSYFNISSRNRLNYSLINMKKKLFVDMKTLKTLNKSKQINWSSSLTSLFPIKTLGDGNCLCHAVLSYIIGMQDINLALRDTLKNFMNDIDFTTELKYRWISYRKASDVANSIQIDDKMLDVEWSEIINMKSAQTDHHNDSKNLDKSSSTLNSDFNSKAISPSQSLIYLEDIHIFSLANLLYRTIIVISLDTLRNIQPIHLRGIYLPLLRRPEDCCKDPILIAFHNFHFMPLLFPLDEESNDSSTEIFNTEKYFHFENIDEMDLKDLNNSEYENNFKFVSQNNSNLSKTSSTSTMMSANSASAYTGFSCKRKKNRFYNTLPLIYYNLESMKIHFLKESEEKNSQNFLKNYLNLVQLDIAIDDLQPIHYEYLNENQTITVLCCYLQKEKDIRNKKVNGITTYLNFLNDSIKKNGNKVVGNYKNFNDESIIVPSMPPSHFTTPSVTPIPVQIVSTTNDDIGSIKKCKLETCSEKSSELNSYGYCSKCYKVHTKNTQNLSTPSPKKEIESEKETQQYQFVSSHASASNASSAAVVASSSATTLSANPHNTSLVLRREEIPIENETNTKSAKLADQNKKMNSVNRKSGICTNPKCNNIVQYFNDSHCPSCKESLIADATRSSSATSSNQRINLSKQNERDYLGSRNTSRTSTTKSPVEIPVKHETSNSSNKISSYNLTPESKLYKGNSMIRSGINDTPQSNYNSTNIHKVNNLSYENESTPSAYGVMYPDIRRQTTLMRDSYNNYSSYSICSNCKYRQVDSSGASSFCNVCRMSPYSKLYY